MAFVIVQRTYRVPGTYQWVKPNTAPGAGPLGSTYIETIVTTIGPGAGGSSGTASNNVGAGQVIGAGGGGGGGYIQAVYAAASMNLLEDIIVSPGSPGQPSNIVNGGVTGTVNGKASLPVTQPSTFGVKLSAHGGGSNATSAGAGGAVSATGGPISVTSAVGQTSSIPGGLDPLSIISIPTGNSAGACGGSSVSTQPPVRFGGNGQSVDFVGGGFGITNGGAAQNGITPRSGGGAAAAVLAGGNYFLTGGNGANALQNTGQGGGGGGVAVSYVVVALNAVTSGAGGKGSDGLVQTTDVYQLPPSPPPYIFEIKNWFHMMNQSRPISLTGRYQS